MSKRLGGIIDCKYENSSWHLIGILDGSKQHRATNTMSGRKISPPLYCTLILIAMQVHKHTDEPGYSSILLHRIWDRMGVYTITTNYYYITISLATNQITD